MASRTGRHRPTRRWRPAVRIPRVLDLLLGARNEYAVGEIHTRNPRTDELNPLIPRNSSIWLGNDIKDYTAHIVAVTLGFRF